MFHRLALQARKPSGYVDQQPIWPWYDSNQAGGDASLAYPNMVLQPGDVWWQQDVAGYGIANAFMYVKTTANLSAGQVVALATPGTDTVTAAGSTTSLVKLTTGGLTDNAEVGNLVYFENGGTTPQLRVIKANAGDGGSYNGTTYAKGCLVVSVRDQNNTFNASDADVLPSTLTNGTNLSIIRPWNRQVCTASMVPQGIALATVTAASAPYTPVQVAGVAMVQAVGNGTATVVNQPAIPSASGVIIGAGGNQGAAPVITLYNAGASIVPLFAFSGAGPQLIPCSVNLLGAI